MSHFSYDEYIERNDAMEKRSKANELQILTYLSPRLKHPTTIKGRLQQLQRGYNGESQFYDIIKENLSEHYIPIYDLLLESDGSVFQIDCLIICNNSVYMYEVKNYTGDYYLQNDRWYIVRSKKEIRNPLLQLERSHYLLKDLIQSFPSRFKVKSFIVFVNESFMLYQAPLNTPIIFPTQIMRHIQTLNRHVGYRNNEKDQKELAEWLKAQQVERNFANLPDYSFDSLNKGMFCSDCLRRMERYNRAYMICHVCKQKEAVELAVLRNIRQFTILFPKKRITTSKIYEWCGRTLSKKSILRILKENFLLIYHGRYSFFVDKT